VNTVVSQALACGVLVVTTRHSGLPEQVLDGVNGFVVEEGDWKGLAERLVYLAAHPELLPRMSRAGRSHVERNYNAAMLVERQIAAYQEVAARSPLRRRRSG
jgi:colanic acid/amylovoran biosynthesis glycosyltransferase